MVINVILHFTGSTQQFLRVAESSCGDRHGLRKDATFLCLFSSYLSCDDKARVAARICATPRIEVMPGHPAMPELKSNSHLADYVTTESWVLFDLIGRGVDWMKEDPSKWDQDEEYLATKDIVDHLCGVNDPAERICGTAKLFKVMM